MNEVIAPTSIENVIALVFTVSVLMVTGIVFTYYTNSSITAQEKLIENPLNLLHHEPLPRTYMPIADDISYQVVNHMSLSSVNVEVQTIYMYLAFLEKYPIPCIC